MTNLKIDIDGLQKASHEMGGIGDELAADIKNFTAQTHFGDLFGTKSSVAQVGNPMYDDALRWMTTCLRSLHGALGDHSRALNHAASSFRETEQLNTATARATAPTHSTGA